MGGPHSLVELVSCCGFDALYIMCKINDEQFIAIERRMMKKYLLVLAGFLGLMQALLCNDEKFECVLYGVHNQDLFQVKKALFMELKLTSEQFRLLTDEAAEIHRKLAEELTLFTSKKDAALFFLGALSCLSAVLSLPGHISGALGLWPISEAERAKCKNRVFVDLVGIGISAYIARKGCQCVYGRVSAENARLIVEAIEKAERASVAA